VVMRPVMNAPFIAASQAIYKTIPFKSYIFRLLRWMWTPPESVYQHLHFSGDFTIHVDADHSFKMCNHGAIYNTLFWRGIAGGGTSLEIWKRLSRDASVIVDIGAHNGLYALLSRSVNKTATIVAFEAVERVFKAMEANVALNRYVVTAENMAVSDRSGEAMFYDLPGDQPNSGSLDTEIAVMRPDCVPISIKTTRLDGYLSSKGIEAPDLIKIDVERHEPSVIRGMEAFLCERKPSLIIEILTEEVATIAESLLREIGYTFYSINDKLWYIEPVETLSPSGVIGQNFLICTSDIVSSYLADLVRNSSSMTR
jgi:FkbM family methyltransferase